MYINHLNEHLRARFGHKLYKLALDGGMTCPNRDGTAGTGGCVFCLEGSGAFAQKVSLNDIYNDKYTSSGSISSAAGQIEAAKERIKNKARDCGYIAYFQSYTNTYAPAEYLSRLFRETLSCPGVEALAVATRPDCLPENTVKLLAELNTEKPVWVELGLQTSYDGTAELINRCYPTRVYDDAVRRLNDAGLETVTHIIFGLPGETREDMLDTVRHVSALYLSERERLGREDRFPAAGVKLQLLHILRGTRLYEMYQAGEVRPLSRDEYIDIVCEALELLPRDIVIHRLTGDGDKRSLAAPMWSADKKGVRAAMYKAFAGRDIIQGSLSI